MKVRRSVVMSTHLAMILQLFIISLFLLSKVGSFALTSRSTVTLRSAISCQTFCRCQTSRCGTVLPYNTHKVHHDPFKYRLARLYCANESAESEKRPNYMFLVPVAAIAAAGALLGLSHNIDITSILEQVVSNISDLGPFGYFYFAAVSSSLHFMQTAVNQSFNLLAC
jgi:hypothetical protein